MMIDESLTQLLRINDELLRPCKFLNEARYGNFIPPYTRGGRTYSYSDRSGKTNCTDAIVMQPYKEYFIKGSALLVHPFSPDWYVGGSVLVRAASVQSFKLRAFRCSGSP
jgi:hypothetical protein